MGPTQAVAILSLIIGGHLTDRIGCICTIVLFGSVTAFGAGIACWGLLSERGAGKTTMARIKRAGQTGRWL